MKKMEEETHLRSCPKALKEQCIPTKNERQQDAMERWTTERRQEYMWSPTPLVTQAARSLVWAQAAWHDSR